MLKKINKKSFYYIKGYIAEYYAILILLLKGYIILKKRYKIRSGEVDIIARKNNIIIFIEVKIRKDIIAMHWVLENAQLKRIQNVALYFIKKFPKYQQCDLRFDLIFIYKTFLFKHITNI